MEEKTKFGLTEILLWTMFALGIDGAAALFDTTVLGMIIAWLIQGFGTLVFGGLVFPGKGNKSSLKTGRLIFKLILHLAPATPIIITALTTTIPWLIEALIHNHPKTVGRVAAVAKIAEKIKTV